MAAEATASYYVDSLVLLGSAVIAAPLFMRLGLGTILGYLAAGLVLGPLARFIIDGKEVLHVAEFGVVLLLFVIGLDLRPARLFSMWREIVGLGLAQIVVCGAAISAISMALGMPGPAALVIGAGLALSSTAFALQWLDTAGETGTRHGERAFAILLMQDLAIVPLLAMVAFLAPGLDGADAFGWDNLAIAVLAIAAMILAGRYLLNPLFRIIANTGAREVMIAAALFIVLGSALALQAIGMSMAMGAFIAGVLLAESSYRHELVADIEPFRGIFLALFFIAVGLSVDINVVMEQWPLILAASLGLMAVKATLLFALCRATGSTRSVSIRVALLLSQGGEFGFVLFTAAAAARIFDSSTASLLFAIITLSMAMTPLAMRLAERLAGSEATETLEESFEGAGSDVLMIGFSRFGQIASQMLLAGGRDVTILDHSAERIRSASRFGFNIYFGDGTRRDMLEAAGIRRAKLVAVCTNRRDITDRIVALVQSEFPHARLYVRAYDRSHALELRRRGVDYEIRETFESGLLFGRKALEALGMDEAHAETIQDDVRRRDAERLEIQMIDGISAGADRVHTRPVSPEPLIRPVRDARALNPEAGAAADLSRKPGPDTGLE